MMNWELIEEAVDLVNKLFETEGIAESTTSIRMRAMEWCSLTDINEAHMLAAATISGRYRFGISWDELIDLREFYFPSDYDYPPIVKTYIEIPVECDNFSIEEIEAAQNDGR